MRDAKYIADRVRSVRARNARRDQDYMKVIAIRKGDYEAVAPGLFNTAQFDRPLVANLIDTTARDIAEVMAPLPAVNCPPLSRSNDSEKDRADKRGAIANSYVQLSRLQEQMFGGADRYGSFGFMAMIVEPDFETKAPIIRVGNVPTAHYTKDYRGRTKEYFEVYKASVDQLIADFPDAADRIKARYKQPGREHDTCEVARYYDEYCTALVLLDPNIILTSAKNPVKKCLVRIVERPDVTGEVRGQYDDVIWVQIARALIQMYTMDAIDQSVNAPIAVPNDVQEMEIGKFSVVKSENPAGIGRVNLGITPQLFPEAQILAQEQRTGSRYPEGRSGSIDASIVTGQGVQALMGTFDTQVQTFQRLFASALEDVMDMCFRMDEAYWPDEEKQRIIKDNGAIRDFKYKPSKDIAGNYTVDVSYGAIAGLDPNRGLIFVLQGLSAGLFSKATARKSIPVDMNIRDEELQIQLEQMDDSIAASISAMPQAIPQMAMSGMDPRELVLQFTKVRELIEKGESPSDAVKKVFAPKEEEQPEAPVDPMQAAMEQAAGGGAGGPELPGQGAGGASDMLMMLAGMTPGGNPNMQANISRMQPI